MYFKYMSWYPHRFYNDILKKMGDFLKKHKFQATNLRQFLKLDNAALNRSAVEPKSGPDGAKRSRICTKLRQDGAKFGEDAINLANAAPNRTGAAPSWAEMAPDCTKRPPDWSKMPPSWAKMATTWAEIAPSGAKMAPRGAKVKALIRIPRLTWPQRGPRGRQK